MTHRVLSIVIGLGACSAAAPPAAPQPAPHTHRTRNCPPERDDGSYDLDTDHAAARRGLADKRFADTRSTVTAPVQLCGQRALLDWLVRVTCADGSRPFGDDPERAHATRTGSFMDIVSCTKPVERYTVRCPERAYDVYFDIYQCGPDEQFFSAPRRD